MSVASVETAARFEAVIGIECHVELRTESKMFCGCRNAFGAEPNTNVCPVCLGLPGALPVPNRLAIEQLVRAGLAFGADIPAFSKFDRKNYFYPDMPKDYQISQYDMPLALGGSVEFWLADGTRRSCRLTRIHLEEDTGKSLHGGSSDGRIAGSAYSLVDFNRAGVPLMECVSEPDIRSAAEAVAYLEALKRTFVTLAVSDVKMEEGSLRCDANVSIRPIGSEALGTKTEIKNMNSFRSVYRAIESEVARQEAVLRGGGRVVQETRGWDEAAGVTHPMRSKEQAHDYRYFPDPDLAPIEFAPSEVARLRESLGELPQARIRRFVEEQGLSAVPAHQLVDSPGLGDLHDAHVVSGVYPQWSANFILGNLMKVVNERGDASIVTTSLETVAASGAVIEAFYRDQRITSKTFADLIPRIIDERIETKEALDELIEREGLGIIRDPGALAGLVDAVLAANEKSAADYRAGKSNALQFLKGQVMKVSRGKAAPEMVEELLKERLAVQSVGAEPVERVDA